MKIIKQSLTIRSILHCNITTRLTFNIDSIQYHDIVEFCLYCNIVSKRDENQASFNQHGVHLSLRRKCRNRLSHKLDQRVSAGVKCEMKRAIIDITARPY